MKRSTAGFLMCSVLLLWVGMVCGHASAESTHEILRMADQARGNVAGMEWEVQVSSIEKDRRSEAVYDVKARGFDVLAVVVSPRKDKGAKILIHNGGMWFHKPGLSRAVPISQRQKLMGTASYGDVAATNYADDYEASLVGEETEGGEACYVYDLKAKLKMVTYDEIKYWVSKERLVGVKAEYFTVSGKKFKTATMEYENSIQTDGKKRPFISKIKIQEDILAGDSTTLTFTKPNLKEIPDSVFDLNSLVK